MSNSSIQRARRNHVVLHILPLLVAALLLGGCNPQRTIDAYDAARGPDSRLDGADITSFAERQNQAVDGLVVQAGLSQRPDNVSDDWNLVVKAGVQYVDEKCESYMHALEDFRRQRDGWKSGVGLTGAAVSATMGILEAAASTIALAGTAFGLTTGLIDVGSGTVLYSISPGSLRAALSSSQQVYLARLGEQVINNRPDSMAAIQNYLSLCLPASLAHMVDTSVATATFTASQTSAENPVPSVTLDVSAPVPPTPQLPAADIVGGARGSVEPNLARNQGRTIQLALCVNPDGDFGTETREAIRGYRRGAFNMSARDAGLDAPLTLAEVNRLLGAGSCAGPLQHVNAYERFTFATGNAIRGLQEMLDKRLDDRTLDQTGVFDSSTRAAIRALSQELLLGDSDMLTPELVDQLPG